MISRQELLDWAESLPADSDVAVDDGGLSLCIVVDNNGHWEEGDAYLSVGGIPLDNDDENVRYQDE